MRVCPSTPVVCPEDVNGHAKRVKISDLGVPFGGFVRRVMVRYRHWY